MLFNQLQKKKKQKKKNKLFSEETEHFLKLERWQGPPHVNKVKQYEIVYPYVFLAYTVIYSAKAFPFLQKHLKGKSSNTFTRQKHSFKGTHLSLSVPF